MNRCHLVEIQLTHARILIFPQTVLVIAVVDHHLLLRNTSVSIGSAVNDVEPIAHARGQLKANALHVPALSGADTVGNFNQLDKATWLKIFMKSGTDIIGALKQLLVAANETSERQMTMLASFVCDAFCPNGIEIRRMFCKQMAESTRLPSTPGTLKQHILRVHVHARICDNMTLRPLQNGFCTDEMGTWYRI